MANKTETNTVKIRLPLTKSEKGDKYVAVNGRTYLIKRGETVEVPDFVAEVLQHEEEMLSISMAYEEQAKEKVQ